jgi:hypothetical protein
MGPAKLRAGAAKLRGRAGWLALTGVLGVAALAGAGVSVQGAAPQPTALVPASAVVTDDAGDARATTSHDGPMVRRRTALALHPVKDADRAVIARRLQDAAAKEGLGSLAPATFAVFSEDLLTYLVPEMTMVLPEGASLEDAAILMRDHDHPTVAFHLVESVLVHDLTFAVMTGPVPPAVVRERIDREGVLADSLNSYRTETQRAGLTVRYFGALLSDGQVLSVRESMARAAQTTPERVFVEPSTQTGGVRLADEATAPQQEHGHN